MSGSTSGPKRRFKPKYYPIDIIDCESKANFRIAVKPWDQIINIKESINKATNIPSNQIELYYKNIRLKDKNYAEIYGLLSKNPETIYSSRKKLNNSDRSINIYQPLVNNLILSGLKFGKMLDSIRNGFYQDIFPELALDGTSGSYFLKNENRKTIAVFKPIDEEAMAPNNPRKFIGQFGQKTFRTGILSGEACIREVAAYMIDQGLWANVPQTTFVELTHPCFKDSQSDPLLLMNTSKVEVNSFMKLVLGINEKIEKKGDVKYGSLQKFVNAFDVAENLSPDLFSVNEVHKIAILDIRILNSDRNEANILVKKKKDEGKTKYVLIPIDHGMCFPGNLEISDMDYCWSSWKQIEEPFSEEFLERIEKINIEADIQDISRAFYFRKECLRNMIISNIMLKQCAKAGLRLSDIIKIWTRSGLDDDTKPSELEKLVHKANKKVEILKDLSQSKQYQEKIEDLRKIRKHSINIGNNPLFPIKMNLYPEDQKEEVPLKKSRAMSDFNLDDQPPFVMNKNKNKKNNDLPEIKEEELDLSQKLEEIKEKQSLFFSKLKKVVSIPTGMNHISRKKMSKNKGNYEEVKQIKYDMNEDIDFFQNFEILLNEKINQIKALNQFHK